MKTLIGLMVLFSVQAHAGNEWFCSEQSSEMIEINEELPIFITACGIGTDKDEQEARQKAFLAAKREFQNLCGSTDGCAENNNIAALPKRTQCSEKNGQFKCYRSIQFQLEKRFPTVITREQILAQPASIAMKPVVIEPTDKIKVYTGMTAKELVAQAGKPVKVWDHDEILLFQYENGYCGEGLTCYVTFTNGRASDFQFAKNRMDWDTLPGMKL